ncbi:MAG: L,D-transpeptidase/peptidoglycan binding protein [Lachnospiraceae bacterium]|nr:L,D-transpeptidase/peptidoglycan binding protein [Lachnospiraceae bacterium]
MRRILKHMAIILGIVTVSLMATYLGLAVYYHNAFTYGTWINGIYCTGRSIQEVNDELVKDFTYEGITVKDKDGNSYVISAEEISYQFDFKKALEIYQKRQNPWMWIDSLMGGRRVELAPVVSYDREAFEACFDALPFCQDKRTDKDRRVTITRTPQGYALVNERTDVLFTEQARGAVLSAIEASEREVSLLDEGCYHDLELTAQMHETIAVWEKLERFQDCGIVYRMGEEEIPVDASVVCDWIALDDSGCFLFDESGGFRLKEHAIEEFVERLAQKYDTVGASRQFLSTRGELVTVEGGLYGNKIDQEAETAYLTEAFYEKKREVHEPVYTQEAWKKGSEDIGSTYIEVDMGEQKMYYYVNGVLTIDTPIVTGNTSRRMDTPSGVNFVYAKQKNRILRGPNYASHVDFWMPVKGNIGIHDAAWRGTFGGTIYQTNGSHGCINTPREAMEQLFDLAEVGTPVIMFY